jgi:hypothetical protein
MTTVEQPDLLEHKPEDDELSPQTSDTVESSASQDATDDSSPDSEEWQTKLQQAVLYWQERAFRSEAWLGRHFGHPWLNNFRDGFELPLPPRSITDPDAFTVQMDVQPKGFTAGSKDDPSLRFVVQLSSDADSVVPHMRRLLDLAQLAGTRITFSPAQSIRPLGSDDRQQGLFEGPPPVADSCQSCGASSLDEFLGPVDVTRRHSPLRCLDTAECDERVRVAHAALDARIGPDPEPEPEPGEPDGGPEPGEPDPVPVAAAQEMYEAEAMGSSPAAAANGWGSEPPPPAVDEHVAKRIRRKTAAASSVGDRDDG